MLSLNLHHFAAASIILHPILAQKQSKIIPPDLSIGFASSGIDIQVSFTGKAIDDFPDGSIFSPNDVRTTPTFAFGDSSGIVTQALYTILLIDTTCTEPRILHFAQTNFKYDFDITNLRSDTKPLLEYKPPGFFEEKGDDRKYSFVMYSQPDRENISELKLPKEGEVFDVQKFRDDNGYEDPEAGIGMVVKLGGSANCKQPSEGSDTLSSSTSSKTTVLQTPVLFGNGTASLGTASRTASSGEARSTETKSKSESDAQMTNLVVTSSAPASPLRQTSTLILTSLGGTGTGTPTGPLAVQETGAAVSMKSDLGRYLNGILRVLLTGLLVI